jgi:hypothetical protein
VWCVSYLVSRSGLRSFFFSGSFTSPYSDTCSAWGFWPSHTKDNSDLATDTSPFGHGPIEVFELEVLDVMPVMAG